jgi:bifunctional polynucleotide phosphatase/kinase
LKPDPKTVKSDQKRLADFKGKVAAVLKQLDIPISVYAATARDQYRKPRTGMWHEILDDHDLDGADAFDLENSIFVGDAGGREALAGGVKDHSCVDRLVVRLSSNSFRRMGVLIIIRDFAANVGLPFHTPEEYFLQQEPRPFTRNFDPTMYIRERELVEKPASACTFWDHQPLQILFHDCMSDNCVQSRESQSQRPSILSCCVVVQEQASLLTIGRIYSRWAMVV